MGKCEKEQASYNSWESAYTGESGNWFAVFGDIDDFIFYDSSVLTDEDEPRSAR